MDRHLLNWLCVQITELRYPLCFNAHDQLALPIPELAAQLHVSRSFVRLCIAVGCPHEKEAISSAGLLLWLFSRYEEVRAVAGLTPLALVEDLPNEVTARLRMANALTTLLEYARTRASDWQQKRRLRMAMEQVNRLADRLP